MRVNLSYTVLSVALASFVSQVFAGERDFSGVECLDIKVNACLKVTCHDVPSVVVKWGDDSEAPSFSPKEGVLKIRNQKSKEETQKAPVSFKGGAISIAGASGVHVGNTYTYTIDVTKRGSAIKSRSKSSSSVRAQNLVEVFLPERGLTEGVKMNLLCEAYACDINERIMKNIQKITYTAFSGAQQSVGEGEEVWTRFCGTGSVKFSWSSLEPLQPLASLSSAVSGVTISEIE
ncbi:MAG: hypothetical protein ACRC4G_03085 [Alphaproteobacteria bacterium]